MNEEIERVFFGRVLPERAHVGLPDIVLAINSDTEHLATMALSVGAAQITARVTGNAAADIATQKNVIRSIVAARVDALGFWKGCGYTVEITGCAGPEGHPVFGVGVDELTERAFEHVTEETVLLAAIKDGDPRRNILRRSLADFRRGILEPEDTLFHSFRAVEAFTYAFGKNPRLGKPRLCKALSIDQRWYERTLELPAAEGRHGKSTQVSGSDRVAALLAARTVIERFIVLLERGLQSLPPAEFPTIE